MALLIAAMIMVMLVIWSKAMHTLSLQLGWADTYMVGCGYSYYDDPKVAVSHVSYCIANANTQRFSDD